MSEVHNLFTDPTEASRFNSFRPHYHDLPFHQLHAFLGQKIPKALDIACGTGHSTRSLSRIADQVIGCDLSEGMLNEARKHSHNEYIRAPAEERPFADGSFDYLHVSMAFQWCDSVASEKGFEPVKDFSYEHEVEMNLNVFLNYLMTRSNFLELNSEQRLPTAQQLEKHYAPICSTEQKELTFAGVLKLFRVT